VLVNYQVTGDAGTASIGYIGFDRLHAGQFTQDGKASLPVSIDVHGSTGVPIMLWAIGADGGLVTCTITANGQVIATDTGVGSTGTSCKAEIPQGGAMSIAARPVVAARAPWVRRDSGLPPFCRTERYATHQLSSGTRNDPQFEYTPALPGITRYEITPCFPGSNNVRPPRTIPRRPDLRGVTGARGDPGRHQDRGAEGYSRMFPFGRIWSPLSETILQRLTTFR
jgi:hypothetical protein